MCCKKLPWGCDVRCPLDGQVQMSSRKLHVQAEGQGRSPAQPAGVPHDITAEEKLCEAVKNPPCRAKDIIIKALPQVPRVGPGQMAYPYTWKNLLKHQALQHPLLWLLVFAGSPSMETNQPATQTSVFFCFVFKVSTVCICVWRRRGGRR